uniref:Ethylene-responsive element-binding family protein n=1 Tax=Rhizophora mucronata TaxID=61149 RepID=A0A2P2IL82_RHIMU
MMPPLSSSAAAEQS